MAFRTMSGQSFTLGSSISSTQTTILLTSFKVPVSGTDITMATMGTDIAYGTLAPGTSSAELISFTGVTQNADGTATLTGVTRGLDKEYPGTEDSNFKQPHAGQTIFILSDAPQIINTEMAALRNDNTWTGRQTLPQSGTASAARAGAVYAAPTQDTELATKKYVDDTASFGAPLATTTTAGIVEIPTATQLETGILLGETGAGLVVLNAQYGARKILGYNVTGGTPNAYTLDVGSSAPTAYATGQIVGFLASFTNTGNATLNINGLGAKNLFLGSTGLFAGAIATNSYIGAVYDGTQFDIIEGSNLITASATASTLPLRRSTGDITVPSTPTASTDATSKGYVDGLNSKIIFSTAFEATGRLGGAVTGNGVRSVGTNGATISPADTAITGSANYTVVVSGAEIYSGSPSWSSILTLTQDTTNGSGTAFFGIGNLTVASASITLTGRHVGFKFVKTGGVTSLYATQADGTTENASSALTTASDGDTFYLYFKINGTSSVDYYWKKNSGSFSSATNLTSNLPTTTTTTLQLATSAQSTVNRFDFNVSSMSYRQ